MENFGVLLKEKRVYKGYSQYKLAELVGVTQPFVNHMEKGSKKPSFDVLVRICEVLEIPLFGEHKQDE